MGRIYVRLKFEVKMSPKERDESEDALRDTRVLYYIHGFDFG